MKHKLFFMSSMIIMIIAFSFVAFGNEYPNRRYVDGEFSHYETTEITTTVTWSKTAGPYYVENMDRGILIKSGGELVIEAGTVVYFDASSDWSGIIVEEGGRLTVNGTSGEPVVMALKPNEAADASWSGIRFLKGSLGSIDYANISKAGHETSGWQAVHPNTAINIVDASPAITNTTIDYSRGYGIIITGSTDTNDVCLPTIENNTINNSKLYPIKINCYKGAPSIQGNSGTGNGNDGILLMNGDILSTNYILYDNPLPFVSQAWDGFIEIEYGNKLTVQPGTVIKFASSRDGGAIVVKGGELSMVGTAGNPIILTAFTDDSVRGDTNNDDYKNNDGDPETVEDEPESGYWSGIRFLSEVVDINGQDVTVTSTGTVSYTNIYYSGHESSGWQAWHPNTTIYIKESSPTISHNLIEHCNAGIDITANNDTTVAFSPMIINNTINNSVGFPIKILKYRGTPDIRNNSGTGNHYNVIYLVNGSIEDSVYTLKANPFIYYSPGYDGFIKVPEEKKLVIEEGTIIKFASSRDGSGIYVNGGELEAIGTNLKPIILTAFADDAVAGDTNQDDYKNGDNDPETVEEEPTVGYWSGVRFDNNGTGTMDYTHIYYSGHEASGWQAWHPKTAIYIYDASPTITNNFIQYCTSGIKVDGATDSETVVAPIIENNSINDSEGYAIELLKYKGSMRVKNNSGSGNSMDVIYLERTSLINTDLTLYKNPLQYYLGNYYSGVLEIPQESSLTIEPGCIIKFYNSGIEVDGGTLNISGTSTAPVNFTSINDDSIGGDTNKNSAETTPAKGDWVGIRYINDGGGAINYLDMDYGGKSDSTNEYSTMLISDSDPTISDVTINNSAGYGIKIKNTVAILNAVTISNSDNTAIRMLINEETNPSINNINFINNSQNGILIDNDLNNKITGNATLHNYGIPYIAWYSPAVDENSTLTIDPGTIIKVNGSFYNYGGTINAIGTSDHPIIFTSLKDDIGGDTNNDGNATYPLDNNRSGWAQLYFRPGSEGTLNYVSFRHGGYNASTLGLHKANVTLDHCEFINSKEGYCIYAVDSDKEGVSNLSVTNTLFKNVYAGVQVDEGFGTVRINNSYFDDLNNNSYAVYNSSYNEEKIIDASNNWWGHSSGPSGQGTGKGYKVSSYVNFTPIKGSYGGAYDYNNDGVIDKKDVHMMVDSYGDTESNYEVRFDRDDNGIIDVIDIILESKDSE